MLRAAVSLPVLLGIFEMIGSRSDAANSTTKPVLPFVVTLQVIRASSAARVLADVFRRANIRVDSRSNSIIIQDTVDDPNAIRAVIAGIDTKDPSRPAVNAIQLRLISASDAAARVAPLFRSSRFVAGSKSTLVVSGPPTDISQIQAVVAAIDSPSPTPTPRAAFPATVIRISQRDPRSVAHAIAGQLRADHVSVSGNAILIAGPPEDIAQARIIASDLDQPEPGVRYTRVYRMHAVQAGSIASLLQRSFHDAEFSVDSDLNALTVLGTTTVQTRISDAITQLDQPPETSGGNGAVPPFGSGAPQTEVVFLHAAVPGVGGGASTSPTDVAQSVSQSLAGLAPDLRITVHPNSTKLILIGTPRSLELAKRLIAQLDVPEPLVELDTEVLEVDEGVQKQLGFKFPTPVLSTTYSELQPDVGTTAGQLLRLQPLTRTPLTLAGELDFLISTNKARILEDPRITTFSGRTASLHAGETVNILTTTGGGTGTVATTQVQSFQTGVTLDITPVVNTDDYVTVTLHPSINSEAGISAAGVPNIQTRDTTTTVGLHDGQTIVVGGLIEDDNSRTVTKVPILGDLPLIGRLFQDVGISHTRNELIVTVTPHIVRAGAPSYRMPGGTLVPPTPAPLPTLDPTATLPPTQAHDRASIISTNTIRAASTATAEPTPAQSVMNPLPATLPTPGPASPSPGPLPSAFAATNTFTFGNAPENNYADPNQPPQIFFVQVQPTVVKNGQTVTLSAITSTNVSSLAFGPSVSSTLVTLSSISPGKWQSTITFSNSGLASTTGNVNETLTAKTALGQSTSLKIPFSLLTQY
jgi:type II secretory pathway component GspD/PulD (secretin)